MNLITGGAGFIGSHLVTQLIEQGEEVSVLERPGQDVSHLPLDKINIIHADICDRQAMQRATKNCDYVYHLAADPNLWRQETGEYDLINFKGALNVIESALENGAKRVLHTSTESILTKKDFKGGSVEHIELNEEDMIGPYCLSKYRADKATLEMGKQGLPVVVVSPTLPVGPGDRNLTPPTRMALAFCRGELPAFLECNFNLIDVRDVSLGMIAAMRHGRPGIRYLLGAENHKLSDWLEKLGNEINRPRPKYQVPYLLALTVAYVSEYWSSYITHEMPLASIAGVKLTRHSMFFDPSQTLKELHLKPRPIEQSAREMIDWFKTEKLIQA